MINKDKETDKNIKELHEKLDKRNKAIQSGELVMTANDFAAESLKDIQDAILKQLTINVEKQLGVGKLPFWFGKSKY